ncbi:MAG TPA: DNA-processing protein DprA [Candidatus Saccharimonadales bacterium]|nr:DNA-processing protein DprA [Candidatus Saccharimonadales bacterium]
MISNSVLPDQSEYLQIITNIAGFPKSLYFSGNLPKNRVKTVSIVGTRKPTDYGTEFAYKFAYELAKRGIVIVSGLAYGIDAIAHKAALDAGGTTIAILPSGLNRIYPSGNAKLADRIVENGGCLLTKYEPDSHPYKSSFVQRSQIVSGIADGVLVIEAGAKSGTMHTAEFARRQGRVVMALPGNINSVMSEGCNNLIKKGAVAITETADILSAIGFKKLIQTTLPVGSNPQEQIILKLITSGVNQTEHLQKQSSLSAAELNQALTMLEISGQIKSISAGKWVTGNL